MTDKPPLVDLHDIRVEGGVVPDRTALLDAIEHAVADAVSMSSHSRQALRAALGEHMDDVVVTGREHNGEQGLEDHQS